MVNDGVNGLNQAPGTSPVPDQLAGLESAIDAARQALGQTQAPGVQSAAVEPTPQSPMQQFQNQFGSVPDTASSIGPDVAGSSDAGAAVSETPSVPEPTADNSQPVAQLDPSINTVADLLAKGPQVVETPSQSEVVLPPKVQEFLDSVLAAAEKFKAPEPNKVTSS